MKKIILFSFASYFLNTGFSQSVGIGTSIPDTSAILDVSSNTKGILIPRLTFSQIYSLPSPAPSMLLYQIDSIPGFYYNAGTSLSPYWKHIGDKSEFSGNKVSYFDGGGWYTFTVPQSIYKINFELVSGGGGSGGTYNPGAIGSRGGGGGGGGGFASGIINVTPGEVLSIYIGNRGINGESGLIPTNGTAGDSLRIKSANINLITLSGGEGGIAGTEINLGAGGSGGHIAEMNSRVFLKSSDFYSIAGMSGSTQSINAVGEGGIVHSSGIFNYNDFFTRTLSIGINITITKPVFGKGGDYSPPVRGYAVFYW